MSTQAEIGVVLTATDKTADAYEALNQRNKAVAKSTQEWADVAKRAGISQAQYNAALRGTPAQISDIIVSLQGGQRPMSVFMQQGFQLRDMFNGWRPAAEALSGSIMKMVTPWTVAGAAVAAFAVMAHSAEQRLEKMSGLVTQFNATGRSIDTKGLEALITRISNLPGISRSAADDMVAAFAPVRQIGTAILEPLIGITGDYAAATGQKIPEAAKKLADAFKEPKAGAKDLDDQLDILTASQKVSIDSLMEHGRVADAQRVLLEALTTKVQGLANDGMTPLQKSADDLTNAWDRLKKSFANTESLTQTNTVLAGLVSKIAWLAEYGSNVKIDFGSGGLADVDRQLGIDGLGRGRSNGGATGTWDLDPGVKTPPATTAVSWDRETKALIDATAKYKSTRNEVDELGISIGKLQQKLQEAKDRGETGVADELGKNLAGAQEKLAALNKKASAGQAALAKAGAGLDIEKIQSQYEKLKAVYALSEQTLEAQHQAGAVSDSEYYEAKRGFIDAESQLLQGSLNAKIAVWENEKTSGAAALQVEKQIADAKGAIDKEQITRQGKLLQLDQQYEASARAKKVALIAVRQAAQDYLDTTTAQYKLEEQSAWSGTAAANNAQAVSQIMQRYADERRRISNDLAQAEANTEGGLTVAARAQYEKRLAIADEFQAKALASYQTHYSAMRSAEEDWTNGARKSYADYLESARNVASQTEGLFTGAFTGMEDSLTSFITTGKGSFSDLANSIIADLVRIQVRAGLTSVISGSGLFDSLISSLTGTSVSSTSSAYSLTTASDYVGSSLGLSISGGRAGGGEVAAGKMYEVNETGLPELLTVGGRQLLMMADDSGYVTPLSSTGSSTGSTDAASAASAGSWLSGFSVEIINTGGTAIQAESADWTQSEDGRALLSIVVKQATDAAVNEVASQIVDRRGAVNRSMTQRERETA